MSIGAGPGVATGRLGRVFEVAAAASHTASAPPPAAIATVRFTFIAVVRIVARQFPAVLLFAVHPASTGSAVDNAPPLEIVAIIPARFASTRFPGKPLADI